MFKTLVRRPSWLVGLLLSMAAFGLHGLALSHGDLAVVQPVIVSGIVFGVLLRAALDRHLPKKSVLGWLVLTWGGLALFLAVRPPTATGQPQTSRAVTALLIGLVVAGTAWAVAHRSTGRRRGILLGGAAGVLFGLVAGLLKMVTLQLSGGIGAALTHWSLWVLVGVGLWAVLLNQRAYQSARLSVTSPMLNILQVIVAIGFGIFVFSEQLGESSLGIAAQLLGLAATIVGISRLAAQ